MERIILVVNSISETHGEGFVIWMAVVSIACVLLIVDRALPN